MREGPSGSAFGDVGPFFSIINAKVRGEGFRRGNSTILTFVDTVVSHEAFTDRLLLRELVRVVQYEKRSEEHTSELQSQSNLVCRLLLEKKKSTQLYPHFYWLSLSL